MKSEQELNRKQILALREFAKFQDDKFRLPYQLENMSVRASTCFALMRRGLLDSHSEPWDWTQCKITELGKSTLKEIDDAK